MIDYRNLPEGVHTGDVKNGEGLAKKTMLITSRFIEAAVLAIDILSPEEFVDQAKSTFEEVAKNIELITKNCLNTISAQRSKKPDGSL